MSHHLWWCPLTWQYQYNIIHPEKRHHFETSRLRYVFWWFLPRNGWRFEDSHADIDQTSDVDGRLSPCERCKAAKKHSAAPKSRYKKSHACIWYLECSKSSNISSNREDHPCAKLSTWIIIKIHEVWSSLDLFIHFQQHFQWFLLNRNRSF